MKKEVIDSSISDLSFHTPRYYLTLRCHCYFLLWRLFLQWPGLAYRLTDEVQSRHLLKRSSERGGFNLLVVSPKRVSHLNGGPSCFLRSSFGLKDVSMSHLPLKKSTQQQLMPEIFSRFFCDKLKDFMMSFRVFMLL